MNPETQVAIEAHAVAEYPRECCGLIVLVDGDERYFPCTNIAETSLEHFVIAPEEYANVEDQGEVIAVVHSHPNASNRPSDADKVACERSGLVWHIIPVERREPAPLPVAGEIYTFAPTGYCAPLVGRPFSFGVLDCYTVIRDYYARELNIELPDFFRRDEFWKRGESLYMDNFAECGFEPIKDGMREGDIILMQIRAPVPNHAAVYIGKGMILHHAAGRLSGRDVYDGYWREVTRLIIRHRGIQ